MQTNDYKWFLENYNAIYEKYGVSYVVIKNKTILGTFETYAEGVRATSKTDEIGTFIVQKCDGNESAYTTYISSMCFA